MVMAFRWVPRTLTAIAVTSGMFLAGCTAAETQSDSPKFVTDGTLTVGISPGYNPMSFRPTPSADVEGTDIDLIEAIADKLELEIEFKELAADEIYDAVDNEEVDVVISALRNNGKHEKQVDMVDYYVSTTHLVTSSKFVDQFHTESDICGTSVKVNEKLSDAEAIEAFNENVCENKDKPSIDIRDGSGYGELADWAGKAGSHLSVMNSETLIIYGENPQRDLVTVLDPIAQVNFGIAVSTANTALRDEIAQILTVFEEDGTTQEIFAAYSAEAGVIQPIVNENS